MKRSRIVPLATEVAETARRAAAKGKTDHTVVVADSETGYPCRHCLRWAKPGERMILFPYPAIPAGRPYSESGPIFMHAESCARYSATNEYPTNFRQGRVFRGYNSSYDMIDAEVANGSEPEVVVEKLFRNPDITFIHARSMTHGCYTFAIERI